MELAEFTLIYIGEYLSDLTPLVFHKHSLFLSVVVVVVVCMPYDFRGKTVKKNFLEKEMNSIFSFNITIFIRPVMATINFL